MRTLSESDATTLLEVAKVISPTYPFIALELEQIVPECGKRLRSRKGYIGRCAEPWGTEHDHDSEVLKVRVSSR